MGDALTEAREALAQIDHPCGVRHSAADLEGVEEVCALAPGHLGAHYGCGPFVDWKEHLRAALAEVDRLTRERDAYRRAKEENDERYMIERDEARREVDGLTTRVAELEARAGDVQRIAAHVRAFRVDASAKRAPWGLMFRLISDAIERGDWRDGTLPLDPKEAERLNLLDYAGGLENTIETLRADADNLLWNLGGVSSVCMGALDADFTFDESAARAALHDAVKLRKEFLAQREYIAALEAEVASLRAVADTVTGGGST